MELITRGAEAEIYLDKNRDKIIKKRVSKRYRISELDNSIRKYRTNREKKILEKLPIPHPKLLSSTNDTIEMEFINGRKLRDILENNISLMEKVGNYTAKMHDAGIIHGDLTTSNIIYYKNEIYFIDFGLSFFSEKVEDKAVDIHLLKQALESKHYKISKKAFCTFLKGYKNSKNYFEVMKRFKIVEARGRNKKNI